MAGKQARRLSWWIGLALLVAAPAACEFDPSGVPESPVVGEPESPDDPAGDVDAAPPTPPGDIDAAPLPPEPPDAAPLPPDPPDAAPPMSTPDAGDTYMDSCDQDEDCSGKEVCKSLGGPLGKRCTLECKPTPPGTPDGCPGTTKCGKDGYCVP